MQPNFLLKGVLVGFSIAAPVGPIGILCVRRTLQFGRLSGLVTGLGAAIADTLYGCVAAFGLTLVSNFLMQGQTWIRLIGGVFLIYLGIRTFQSPPAEKNTKVTHKSLLGDFISTFLLTITNPMTIISYLAVFAGFGFSHTTNYKNSTELLIGIFIGSALWWVILSEGVTLFRKRISKKVMKWINRVAGSIIILFGLFALISDL